ncbi:hypothetical protein [Streptomyces aurantiogriseus]|uniref:hypothetical protein n=1 Tax=Streptomyces aurantiogriseus TaxID=66870 RepID=UPI0016752A1B|nr:hypothetical protein [Streptomyces aurantiogriseus]
MRHDASERGCCPVADGDLVERHRFQNQDGVQVGGVLTHHLCLAHGRRSSPRPLGFGPGHLAVELADELRERIHRANTAHECGAACLPERIEPPA